MASQVLKEKGVEREEKVAKLVGIRYKILRVLYTSEGYTLTKLKITLDDLIEKPIDLGNLSKSVKALKDVGLVLKLDEEIKLSSGAREIIYAIEEAVKPEDEKPWQPQSGEAKLCIEALEAKDTEEMYKAFLPELGSILNSGYLDNQLVDFFIKALDNPEKYENEIEKLLRAHPRSTEKIDLFFKRKRDKIYDLVKSSGRLSSLALRIFVDVSEGNEALDRMEADLKGEGGDRVLSAAKDYGRSLYEKFGLSFKMFLRKALGHESEIVRQHALELMNEISFISET